MSIGLVIDVRRGCIGEVRARILAYMLSVPAGAFSNKSKMYVQTFISFETLEAFRPSTSL